MEIETAVVRLFALAQDSRLSVFRLLLQKGPEGLPAGEVAERLGITPSALSFHLKELSNAGLVTARQEGRYIYYAPDFEAMNDLLDYLTENCCADGTAMTRCAQPRLCKEK